MTEPSAFARERRARTRRVRRHAVPGRMIEVAAERRLAGDWRGACAAARMDVTFDLEAVSTEFGAEIASQIEDDLRHLVPDLVRWHAPRVGGSGTTLAPGQTLVLAVYGQGGAYLCVRTPPWRAYGPQDLVLEVVTTLKAAPYPSYCTDLSHVDYWTGLIHPWWAARHLWDARHTDELRERCGGDACRVPFFEPDGTLRQAGRLPVEDPGPGDPAGHAEWVMLLHERGEMEAAFAAAGIDLLPPHSSKYRVQPLEHLARLPLALTRVRDEMDRLGADGAVVPWTQHATFGFGRTDDRVGVWVDEHDHHGDSVPMGGRFVFPDPCWRVLPDLDLLRDGRTSPDVLHPLVRAALFPERGDTGRAVGPPGPAPLGPVRVRCRGEWHQVAFRDGELTLPHSAEEQRREAALEALGGSPSGCFAVRNAWRTGTGRLPRALRELRRDVFDRFHHGDTDGIVELMDMGLDPHVRDGENRTLLHALHLVDHEKLLPRIVAAGVDIDAEATWTQRTPLLFAIDGYGSEQLIRDLLDAGASMDVFNEEEMSILEVIRLSGRGEELEWLEARLEEEHPDFYARL